MCTPVPISQWGEDDESRAYDKSVEETVREIDGLGVYVAPADDAKPAKQPAQKPGKGAGK